MNSPGDFAKTLLPGIARVCYGVADWPDDDRVERFLPAVLGAEWYSQDVSDESSYIRADFSVEEYQRGPHPFVEFRCILVPVDRASTGFAINEALGVLIGFATWDSDCSKIIAHLLTVDLPSAVFFVETEPSRWHKAFSGSPSEDSTMLRALTQRLNERLNR